MSIYTAFRRALHARQGVNAFLDLPTEKRNVVFYSEDDFSYMHFEALIRSLVGDHGIEVAYLTSQHDDPILATPPPGVRPFFVGTGISRTSLFLKMKADVLVMTMPDLETFHLKRSKVADVHYLYVFHAMVSTHSNYREHAFDAYDTVFLTGPYQRDEIRATEEAYGLRSKTLIDYGYPRLEALIRDVRTWREDNQPAHNGPPRVIVAPSWGPTTILESIGVPLVDRLIKAGFFVTVRPHPVTRRKRPDLIEELQRTYGRSDRFVLECDVRDKATLYEADVMICDWSGVAMEYAFSCERPVLFIDVPKKKNNPQADLIGIVPIEVSIRSQIGEVLSPDELDQLPQAVARCIEGRDAFVDRIRDIRSRYVFNLHDSIEIGAKYISELARSRNGLGNRGQQSK